MDTINKQSENFKVLSSIATFVCDQAGMKDPFEAMSSARSLWKLFKVMDAKLKREDGNPITVQWHLNAETGAFEITTTGKKPPASLKLIEGIFHGWVREYRLSGRTGAESWTRRWFIAKDRLTKVSKPVITIKNAQPSISTK